VIGTGAFARLAGVSVRTLHHYDEIGLLRPATVDPRTGYRWYAAPQLARLNRILALRDLGFSLADIGPVVDDQVTVEELRGMVRLRHAEAQQRLAAEAARLARVEARLDQIEEDPMDDYDVIVKPVERLTVAVQTETTDSFGEQLSEILPRRYGALHAQLAALGIEPSGPAVAVYEDSGDEAQPIRVVAALPVEPPDPAPPGLELRDLPALPRAVTTVHHGSMAGADAGYRTLVRWADVTGERLVGFGREVYLDCDGPPDTWVTELQYPLGEPAGAAPPDARVR
jgi:DNA-binding transcriptional MerR regulator